MITLTSISSHSFQQEAQTESSTFSLTAGANGTRCAGGASPGFPQWTHDSGIEHSHKPSIIDGQG